MDVNRSNESYIVRVYSVTDTVSQGDTSQRNLVQCEKHPKMVIKGILSKIETPTGYKHYETMLENVTNVQTNILMYS